METLYMLSDSKEKLIKLKSVNIINYSISDSDKILFIGMCLNVQIEKQLPFVFLNTEEEENICYGLNQEFHYTEQNYSFTEISKSKNQSKFFKEQLELYKEFYLLNIL